MHRSFRSLSYRYGRRDVVLGLVIGTTAAFSFGAWGRHRPVRADSAVTTRESAWNSRPQIVANYSPPSDRTGEWSERPGISAKSNTKGLQIPPPQTKGHSTFDAEGDLPNESVSAWQEATTCVTAVCDSFSGFDFGSLRLRIASMVMPSWISALPGYAEKLRNELSGAPWSLSWAIWEDAHDPEVNPEITWAANVRISKDLCRAEQQFLAKRRENTRKALARYLGVSEEEIHPDDVPVIAMCGSGGGLRALVAGAASYLSAQEAGLFDCITYTAGVSGSCWLQTLYYSSIGRQSLSHVISHLKDRIGVHIAYPPAALSLLNQAPTNKFLLSGLVEKLRGVPDADFGTVDVYGLLLAARLLVPKGELGVSDLDLKVSGQSFFTDDGAEPLPIYTAVRHEIPAHFKRHSSPSQLAWPNTKHYDWFQWFEWTPYELFCEELECGIPTWAVGRQWRAGNSLQRENGLALPELRVPLMMGIWGSAFCATLSHYYKEIRPIIKASGLGRLDSVLSGKDDDLAKVHPINPAVIPNFALGLRDRLPSTVPESIHKVSHLQLMDAGMSNNLPIYPLLRPDREVDVIVAFDASADVKTDNWIKAVDGYARQRGIKGWPMGAGWPPESNAEFESEQELNDAQLMSRHQTAGSGLGDHGKSPSSGGDLGYCTVWVGTTEERQEYMDEPPSRRLRSEEDDWHLTKPDAGITLIYFPFLANKDVPGVDPMKSDFMSTWNFVYSRDEIDKVVALARANFEQGREQTRRAIRAVWERKKMNRLERTRRETELLRANRMRRAGAHLSRNGDVGHGDQFAG